MAKWKLAIILMMIMVPLVMGANEEVYWSEDNITWKNATQYDFINNEVSVCCLEQSTLYYFRARNESSEWIYFTNTTLEGMEAMTAVGIIGFLIILNLALFIFPFFVKFHKVDEYDQTIKKIIWWADLAILAFTTSIIVSLADHANLGINQQLFAFQWIFVRAIYFLLIVLMWHIVVTIMKTWKYRKTEKRMGEQ